VAGFQLWHEVRPVPLAVNLVAFPTTIGGWRFDRVSSASGEVAGIGFDQALSRSYIASDGKELDLVVGYFERQLPGRELAGFQLWRLTSLDGAPAQSRSQSELPVRDFVSTVDGVPYHTSYWYFVDDRIVLGDYQAKWWTAWNALTRRTSNGGIVMVRRKLQEDESLEMSRSRLRDFLRDVIGVSRDYLAG
jgi:EpsI family protein